MDAGNQPEKPSERTLVVKGKPSKQTLAIVPSPERKTGEDADRNGPRTYVLLYHFQIYESLAREREKREPMASQRERDRGLAKRERL